VTKYPHSTLGKAGIDGHSRSPQQKQFTQRPTEDWRRYEACSQNGKVVYPPSECLTPEQQKYKHYTEVSQPPQTATAAVPLGKGRKNRAESFGVSQPPGGI